MVLQVEPALQLPGNEASVPLVLVYLPFSPSGTTADETTAEYEEYFFFSKATLWDFYLLLHACI